MFVSSDEFPACYLKTGHEMSTNQVRVCDFVVMQGIWNGENKYVIVLMTACTKDRLASLICVHPFRRHKDEMLELWL